MAKAKVKERDHKYWLGRAERRKTEMEKLWPTAAAAIAREYQKVAVQMQDRLAAFYGKFGKADDKGNIIVGFQEAMKTMGTADAISFKNRVTAARRKYAKTPDKNFKEQLDQYSRTMALPRFLSLDLDAQILAHDAAVAQAITTTNALAKNSLTAYYYTVNEIEAGLGVGLKYGAMNAKQVRELITTNWSGKEFSERIWDDRTKLATDLKRVMVDGFTKRKRNEGMAKDIAERFDVSYSSAERLVRTESARIVEAATQDAYKEIGVEQYEYSAILDERTSEICEELDGKIFNTADEVQGVNAPPMHPNCRSTTLPVFDNERIEIATVGREYDSFADWKRDNEKSMIDSVAKEAVEPIVQII